MGRKAVFLDVDGTFINERGLAPDSAKEAVVQARRNGHLVFLCTGRSLSELWQEITDVGFDGIVAAAGGYVQYEETVLVHHSVPGEAVRHVVDYFAANGIDYFLESNTGIYGSANSQRRLRELFFSGITDEDVLAEMQRGLGGFIDSVNVGGEPDSQINKVSFLHSDVPLEVIRAEFAGEFDVIPATVPMFGANSGELSLSGVHKAGGIAAIIDHVGIARADTIAFGDGFNDLEMLEFVGTGVAMGNAHPTVKAVADDVTGTPDEGGIHAGFRKYGLI